MSLISKIVKIIALFSLILILENKIKCTTERITYISTEHPAVTYFNEKYVKFLNITSRRYGRRSLFYYVDLHMETLVYFDSTVEWVFNFYEYLSNTYRPTFVVMRFKTCDLIMKDMFFGPPLRRSIKKCPMPPDVYHITNCSIPVENIPPGFPFTKGRIYLNTSYIRTKELIGAGYIDMEIKSYNPAKKKTGGKRTANIE